MGDRENVENVVVDALVHDHKRRLRYEIGKKALTYDPWLFLVAVPSVQTFPDHDHIDVPQ